jgi:hypothetical protein
MTGAGCARTVARVRRVDRWRSWIAAYTGPEPPRIDPGDPAPGDGGCAAGGGAPLGPVVPLLGALWRRRGRRAR